MIRAVLFVFWNFLSLFRLRTALRPRKEIALHTTYSIPVHQSLLFPWSTASQYRARLLKITTYIHTGDGNAKCSPGQLEQLVAEGDAQPPPGA